LAAVEAGQTEGQTALWTIERARPTQNNLFEIRRIATLQRLYERLVSRKIDQPDARLQDALRIRSGLIG
jgi:hypothetical protein